MCKTTRRSLTVLLLLLSGSASGQDMVGPSTDPANVSAVPVIVETPETLSEDDAESTGRTGTGDVSDRSGTDFGETFGDSAGEGTVLRPDADSEFDEPRSALPTIDPDGESGEQDDFAARWQRHFDAADYGAAAEVAETWVAAIERTLGDDAAELFYPLVQLGRAYEWSDDPERAGRAYDRAVATGETHLGVFDMLLVEPLAGLGRSLYLQGNAEDAVPNLMRAKDITHRNLGIYNLEQESIIQNLAESYLATGEFSQATREQRLAFGANEKAFGDGPELVPALQRWAHWNVRMARFADARRYYSRALDILEDAYGPNDLRLVETLDLIANSFYHNAETTFPREGTRALERVIEIYGAQEFVDQADLMRAHTRLGDWLMVSRQRTRSVQSYEEAVRTAREAGMDAQTIDAFYGQPWPLHSNDMPISVPGSQLDSLADGPRRVLVEFTVDRRGRPHDIRVVEDSVGLVSVLRQVRDRISTTAFRPRFVNGEAVPTEGVRMLFEFDLSSGTLEPAGTRLRQANDDAADDADADAADDADDTDDTDAGAVVND